MIFVENGGPMRSIKVGDRILVFEMHPYCGPSLLNKRGDPLKVQPHYFLRAASLWCQQGQRIDENGMCVWEEGELQ